MAILHRNRNLSALMPRYVARFRCVGASCEDTCCAGWSVHIDKKTYKAYRNQTHEALKPVVAAMQRIDNPADPTMYGVLPVAGLGGDCPALQNGMCAIQANIGTSYLPDTCDTFPRLNRNVNGQVEQSLTLSCPEAARLALLSEDAFDFIEAPVSVREGTVYRAATVMGMTNDVMNELRIFSMNLMRTRELALWQRLALLGTFCEALDRDRGNDAASTLINEFTRLIENGELLATLELIQPNYEAQAMVFATLWASKGFEGQSAYQQAQMARIAEGLGADANGQVSAAGLVAAYRNGLCRLDQALTTAPWLIEHFILNEMFIQQFPVGGVSAYESFLRLVARFGLLRFLLAAQCNGGSEVPPLSVLVATAGLQSRRFQHNAIFTQQVNRSLHESGWGDLDKLYMLLRT